MAEGLTMWRLREKEKWRKEERTSDRPSDKDLNRKARRSQRDEQMNGEWGYFVKF